MLQLIKLLKGDDNLKDSIRAKVSKQRKAEKKKAYRDFDMNLTKDIKIKGPQPEIEYLRDLMNIASGPTKKTRHSMIIELLEKYIEKNNLI